MGYWEDVGTIRNYYEANLALTDPIPPFDLFDALKPIYTNPRFLPATKVDGCTVRRSLIAEGCIVLASEIERSVVGIRSRIGAGARLRNSLVLGADYYETLEEIENATRRGIPPVGVGDGSFIDGAILDKNARVGRDVRIVNEAKVQEQDGPGYFIRDGVVLVPKGGVIPDGTVI
jgi:glucose-1-phosphate adenylyltransferase